VCYGDSWLLKCVMYVPEFTTMKVELVVSEGRYRPY
jgi:hypothetical protein